MKDWFRRHNTGFRAAQDVNREIPEDLWVKCGRCGELLYQRELENNDMVCTKCDYHFRLRAAARIGHLTDAGTFEERFCDLLPDDPLGFRSAGETYKEKLHQAQRKTGLSDALTVGTATIQGCSAVIAVVDFSFQGGSMGSVYGEKLVRAVELAMDRRLPMVTVSASGGARMQEGMFSLMQLAKTTTAFAQFGRERLPHVSVLTDPCTGGVMASYASTADVVIAEPGALIGFAGPRVIEQITRQKLPSGFQSSEACFRRGMLDMVVHRRDLPATLGRILQVFSLRGVTVAQH
ncbi:MAG: acetyl-CoA carboxylase, carboxyltransferase subunit beta [Chloroflexota bacterium]|nr:acetyl-CoA carboxylase, carboxyltransferase subunit beta [Chloroflexota bacterium]